MNTIELWHLFAFAGGSITVVCAVIGVMFNLLNNHLKTIAEGVNKRIDDVNKRFDDVNKRFDDVNKRIDETNQRMDKGFDDVNRQIETMNNRIEAMNNRFDERLDNLNKTLHMILGSVIPQSFGENLKTGTGDK